MNCNFSNENLTCPVCTFDARIIPDATERAVRQCDGRPMLHRQYVGPWPRPDAPATPPSLVSQAWSYAAAVTQWTAAGRPNRTDEEVSAILQICQACPHYKPVDDTKGHCLLCGCGCSADASALTNKLRMATGHCPDQPARW